MCHGFFYESVDFRFLVTADESVRDDPVMDPFIVRFACCGRESGWPITSVVPKPLI